MLLSSFLSGVLYFLSFPPFDLWFLIFPSLGIFYISILPIEKVKNLNGLIYHFWMKDFEHQINKMNQYTSSLANNSPKKSMSSLLFRMLFGFQFDFFKAYFLRHHWLQGRYGFAVAMLYAFTRFMRVIKMNSELLWIFSSWKRIKNVLSNCFL